MDRWAVGHATVHSFSKYCVYEFGNRQMNGRTDGRTDRQVDSIMPPPASLAWQKDKILQSMWNTNRDWVAPKDPWKLELHLLAEQTSTSLSTTTHSHHSDVNGFLSWKRRVCYYQHTDNIHKLSLTHSLTSRPSSMRVGDSRRPLRYLSSPLCSILWHLL